MRLDDVARLAPLLERLDRVALQLLALYEQGAFVLSQPPHKTVNLTFKLAIVNIKLTILCGS